MSSSINMPAIIIANTMGISILFAVAVGNFWRMKGQSAENKYLTVIFAVSLCACIIDPICFFADGKPGLLNYISVAVGNALLYLGNFIISAMWVMLVTHHMHIKLSRTHKTVIQSLLVFVTLCLIINFFTPVLFKVDKNNVYSRTEFYFVYSCLPFLLQIDILHMYFDARRKNGGLSFFPVWAFIIPNIIGMLIQIRFYGVSTITPFITVSVICVITCLQNESMYVDKLTGLYNRFYLNSLEQELTGRKDGTYSAIMLDINSFKTINDSFGHKTGDEALIHTSGALLEAVGSIGEVIRYAGDEFIIILNTQDDAKTEAIIAKINTLLASLCEQKALPYKLSVSYGYCKLRFGESTMDEFVDKIDKLMYENKREYYRKNCGFDRRKR